MSKRFMFLIGCIVFFLIASEWYWEEQQLAKPIVINTRVDLNSRLIEVSYIVNRNDDTTRLLSVNLGDETFYPIGSNNMFTPNNTSVINLQQFSYYSIRSEMARIDDHQYDYLKRNLPLLNVGTVSLSSYAPINLTPTSITESINNIDSLLTTFESDGDGNVNVILESKSNLVIDKIKIIHPTATIDKIAPLPLILKEGQKIEIQLGQVFALFRYGYLDVIVRGTENDNTFESRYLTNFDDKATEKFIRAYVKEAIYE